MPKILITGNGFDLSYNLPTTYKDCIQIIKKLNYNSDFISALSNSPNFEILRDNFSIERVKTDPEKIYDMIEVRNISLWFNFFDQELEIETWIDFENRIELVLKTIYTAVEVLREKIFHKGAIISIPDHDSYSLLNNNIIQLEILKSFNLIKDNVHVITINEEFVIHRNGHYIDLDLQKITKFLYQELQSFQKLFIDYFDLFVLPLYQLRKSKIDRSYLKSINHFFTFNYTATLNLMADISLEKTFHLHGNIEKKNIVLGINEIPDNIMEKKSVLPFTKYYQKLSYDTDYKFLDAINLKLNENYQFFFWGHSLDSSDADYINEVFDIVTNLKSKIKMIIIVYHNIDSKNSLLINLLSIRGKNDIDAKTRSEQLIFVEADSEELKKEIKRDLSSKIADIITY